MNELMADVWKILKEVAESQQEVVEAQKKTEKAQQEVVEAQKKTEKAQQQTKKSQQELVEAQKKTEKAQQQTEKAQQQTEKELKELGRRLDQASGNFNNKWGLFMEGFVKGNLIQLLRGKNIDVQRVQPRLKIPSRKKGELAGDFDLVAINGEEIVAVEVKTTLSKDKLKSFLFHLKKFKEYFPEYGDKVVYGGVAYMDDLEDAGEAAMEQGLFAIAAPGGDASVAKIVNPEGFTPKAF